jgi:predicted Na+-dependent transporter
MKIILPFVIGLLFMQFIPDMYSYLSSVFIQVSKLDLLLIFCILFGWSFFYIPFDRLTF